MGMFCYQCEEASKQTGCTVAGVCGKKDDIAALQDMIVYLTKGLAVIMSKVDENIDLSFEHEFVAKMLFITVTNANFNKVQHFEYICEIQKVREALLKRVSISDDLPDCATWKSCKEADIEAKAVTCGVLTTENEDIRSLRELLIYGAKGVAAYYHHSNNLEYTNDEIPLFLEKALVATLDDDLGADELVALVLECGKNGVDVMALLDQANTESYGNPEITEVNIGVGTKPGILISGHDLKDMELLLKATEGTGVDVYTHCEMLPAHYYPAFKKYDHFVGNYGGSWYAQHKEFETFNGPIFFTSNCIVPTISNSSYKDMIFTTNASGLENGKHIDEDENGHKDFSEMIAIAKTCKAPTEIETGKIVGGFAHAQVFALADKVIDAVKSGAIKKFVVMGGCDGKMKEREYYTEFAEKLPKDTIILTAGCAKFRYNKLNLGDIGGIPRILDAGQCNDSYSLAIIAMKLKEVFELEDINDLPIAYNIAWYEQKAVIVLLALLYLGVKNIKLGPHLPAFLSPNVANVLIEKFGINGINSVDEDIVSMIG